MNNIYFNQVQAYLTNALSPAEKQAFETELGKNDDLAAELAIHQLEHRAIQLDIHDDLRKKMSSWTAEEATEPAKTATIRRLPLRRVLSIAAGFLLLFSIGTSWWANNEYSNQNLTLANNSYPQISQRRGATNVLTQAQHAIGAGDFEQAIALLSEEKSLNADLLKGAAFLGLKEWATAKSIYQKALEKGSTSQQQLAQWQLVLIALNQGQNDEVQAQLNAIINAIPAHRYRSEAVQLQEQLNSKWRMFVWG